MPPNAHDALFKWSFSQVEHAVGELKLLLPPELVARIDGALCCIAFGTLGPRRGCCKALAGGWA